MPSEQPREGTQVHWRCSYCKEPVSGPSVFCGGKFSDHDHPPMARPELSNTPAQPEQSARVDGLSAEDRARLEEAVDRWDLEPIGCIENEIRRCLALIDHQAKALEAADELARHYDIDSGPEEPLAAYRSTRTTERTTDG